MKNWVVILWLLLFFPVGLYLMYKHTDWSKKVKTGITIFYVVFAMISIVSELVVPLLGLTSFLLIPIGALTLIYSFIKKTDRRKGTAILFLGILLFAFSAPRLEAQEAERIAIELQEKKEQDRIAEEKRQEEVAKKEEQERIEKEKQLKQEATEAVELVETEPTRENYDKAFTLIQSLDLADSTLENKLSDVKPLVEEYEEKVSAVEEAIAKAEETKDRETYEQAYELAAALPIKNARLDNRLVSLNRELTKIEEEERIAAEKAEEERIAAEKAEQERVAKEKEAEEQRIAAEKEAQAERKAKEEAAASEEKKQESVQPTPPADNVSKVVYIAPQSGTKYHHSSSCRGLNNANSIQEIGIQDAKNQGYTLCGWED